MYVTSGLHPWLWVTAPLLVVAWVIKKFYDNLPPRLDFPMVGSENDKDLSSAVIEGYKKVDAIL